MLVPFILRVLLGHYNGGVRLFRRDPAESPLRAPFKGL